MAKKDDVIEMEGRVEDFLPNTQFIVTLDNDEKEIHEYKTEELKFKPRHHRENQNVDEAELRELEKLERSERTEGKSKLDEG